MDRRELFHVLRAATAFAIPLPEFGEEERQRVERSGKHQALFEAANRCSKAAENCVCHFVQMPVADEKGLEACTASSREVLVVCNGLRALAAQDSAHLALYAKVAAEICRSCEAECRRHSQHLVCKACGDACAACAAECDRLA